jgi:hypothetical protein
VRNWAWARGSCQRRTTWRWSCESKLGRRRWRPAAWRRTHLLPAARIEAADPHRLPHRAPRLRCEGTGVSCRLRGPPWRSHARWRSASLGSSLPVTPVGVLAVDAVLAPPTAAAGQQGRRASSTSRSWPAPAVSCGCVAGAGGSG